MVARNVGLIPQAEGRQLRFAADPDRRVPEVPGNELVGETEGRLFDEDVARPEGGGDRRNGARIPGELALSRLDQADRVAEHLAQAATRGTTELAQIVANALRRRLKTVVQSVGTGAFLQRPERRTLVDQQREVTRPRVVHRQRCQLSAVRFVEPDEVPRAMQVGAGRHGRRQRVELILPDPVAEVRLVQKAADALVVMQERGRRGIRVVEHQHGSELERDPLQPQLGRQRRQLALGQVRGIRIEPAEVRRDRSIHGRHCIEPLLGRLPQCVHQFGRKRLTRAGDGEGPARHLYGLLPVCEQILRGRLEGLDSPIENAVQGDLVPSCRFD